jgi:hypothetical protein
MSLLNVNLNFLGYLDALKSTSPRIKMADQSWSLQGLSTGKINTFPIALAPGETKTIMSTTRVLSYTTGTGFSIVQVPGTCQVRLTAAIGQRIGRPDGDDTTEWDLAVTNNLVTLTFTGTGTAPNFAFMVAGDGVYIGSAFQVYNQGNFTVTRVGSNFIQYVNELAQTQTVTGQVDVFSNGPVQINDTLYITSPAFSFPNQGTFTVVAVTDQWIQYSNPNAIIETVTGVASGTVTAYLDSYMWMLTAVDHRVVLNLNGDSGGGLVVEPQQPGNLVENPGLLLKRGRLFSVSAYNPGVHSAEGFVVCVEQ